MSELWTLLTPVNLAFAIVSLSLGVVKAFAARKEPGLALALTSSVLILCSIIFLLATPVIYRTVGAALGSPNLPGVLIPCLTILCVGHAHLMTQLWQPDRAAPQLLRQWAVAWVPLYALPPIVMLALYMTADLSGQGRPLRFAATYADHPQVVGIQLLYTVALTVGIVATLVQCRKLTLPDRPDLARALARCINWFSLALSLDLLNLATTMVAVISALRGDHQLDYLAEGAWLATIASCAAANWGLGSLVLAARRGERRDYKALKPLWRTVTRPSPQLILAPGNLWNLWDTRVARYSRFRETLDGIRHLYPWMEEAPARAVLRLVTTNTEGRYLPASPARFRTDRQTPLPPAGRNLRTRLRLGRSPSKVAVPLQGDIDILAAQAAAILLHAARSQQRQRPPLPDDAWAPSLPGIKVSMRDENDHLVQVAKYLNHPVVLHALELVDDEKVLSH